MKSSQSSLKCSNWRSESLGPKLHITMYCIVCLLWGNYSVPCFHFKQYRFWLTIFYTILFTFVSFPASEGSVGSWVQCGGVRGESWRDGPALSQQIQNHDHQVGHSLLTSVYTGKYTDFQCSCNVRVQQCQPYKSAKLKNSSMVNALLSRYCKNTANRCTSIHDHEARHPGCPVCVCVPCFSWFMYVLLAGYYQSLT